MSENVEAKVVESEELSIQEKEELVQEKAGAVFEDGMYKVDLTQPPAEQTEQTEDAIQEPEAEGSVLRGDEPAEEAGEEAEMELQEVRQEEEVKEEAEELVLEELPEVEETQEETIKEVEDLAEEVEEAFAGRLPRPPTLQNLPPRHELNLTIRPPPQKRLSPGNRQLQVRQEHATS